MALSGRLVKTRGRHMCVRVNDGGVAYLFRVLALFRQAHHAPIRRIFVGPRFLVDSAGLCALATGKHTKSQPVSSSTKQKYPSEVTSPPQNYACCKTRGCNKPARVRGYCLSCYRRIARLVRLGRSTWDDY